MAIGETLSILGTFLSGVASVGAVYISWEVRKEQRDLKRKLADFYIEKVKIRIERILGALQANFTSQGEISLIIHSTPRDFNNIGREGIENSISVDEERIIEEIVAEYNNYLYACWIDKDDSSKWLTPTSVRDIEEINEKSKKCYETIKALYDKL